MENDGKVKYFNTISPATGFTVFCNGVTYDVDTGVTSVLISTNSNSLKSSMLQDSTITDAVLYMVSDTGTLLRGKHITLATSTNKYSTTLTNNIMKKSGDFYIWAGISYGYTTSL